MRVKVYRNLKHGKKAPPLYSVVYKGRVIMRVGRILLKNAEFRVSKAGRERVLREKRKNVHAFVVGHIAPNGTMGIDRNGPDLPVKMRYNPYVADYFFNAEFPSIPVITARAVLINERGISACYTN